MKTKNKKLTIEDCLNSMDKFQLLLLKGGLRPSDLVSSFIKLRKEYLQATSGLRYNSEEENEKLWYRRMETFEKIYNNHQHWKMLTCDDED